MFKIGDLVTLGELSYVGVVIETFEYSCTVRWLNPMYPNWTNPSSHGYKMLCKVS